MEALITSSRTLYSSHLCVDLRHFTPITEQVMLALKHTTPDIHSFIHSLVLGTALNVM